MGALPMPIRTQTDIQVMHDGTLYRDLRRTGREMLRIDAKGRLTLMHEFKYTLLSNHRNFGIIGFSRDPREMTFWRDAEEKDVSPERIHSRHIPNDRWTRIFSAVRGFLCCFLCVWCLAVMINPTPMVHVIAALVKAIFGGER